MENRNVDYMNPLGMIGDYPRGHYVIFREHLTIPKYYLRGIFQLYPNNIKEALLNLPAIVERCHKAHWGRINLSNMEDQQKSLTIQYMLASIPPMYYNVNTLPSLKATYLKVYSDILDDVKGFTSLGRTLYFYSEFEEGAMLAAANLMKAAVRAKIPASMISLPVFMEEVKKFDDSAKLRALENAEIACVSLLGTAYKAQSGFTEATFTGFLAQRKLNKKTTILSSHLTPDEFKKRFGTSLERIGAIPIEAKDDKMLSTLQTLAAELAELKAKKV